MKKISGTTFNSLSEYINYLQTRGEYVFTQKSAQEKLGCSDAAIRLAANRLIRKKRIIKLRYTFYLIIPFEYQTMGAPPASWYIDALMRQHHQQPYYVALLSAAALHGAAHQQPQVFQIITSKPLRPITIGRSKVVFIVKKNLQNMAVMKIKTQTGYMDVATPETTAFDLVHYPEHAGGLHNVATVLQELVEKIDANKLLAAAKSEKLPTVQRVGYLIEKYALPKKANEVSQSAVQPLLQWLRTQKIHPVLLKSEKQTKNDDKTPAKNQRWQIYENEIIETDL